MARCALPDWSTELRFGLQHSWRLAGIPFQTIWSSYDTESNVLHLNFKKPSHADDTELTDDDILVRYENGEVIGVTVPHASQRRTDSGKN